MNTLKLLALSVPLIGILIIHDELLGRIVAETPAVASVTCASEALAPDILGAAGFALNIRTNEELFNKNADATLPLASLTKLMTVYAALATLGDSAMITIDGTMLGAEGGGVPRGSVWSIEELSRATIAASLNDGARALSLASAREHDALATETDAASLITKRAHDLRLPTLSFLTVTGLDVSDGVSGALGSARDIASLAVIAENKYPDVFTLATRPTYTARLSSGRELVYENTSSLASRLLGTRLSKTGYTDLAGGNLLVIFEPIPGNPIVVVVLGSTKEGREIDVGRIADYATQRVKRAMLCSTARAHL